VAGARRSRGEKRLAPARHYAAGNAVGERHGFFLIVSDKKKSDSDRALQGFQFALHQLAQIGIEGGKRPRRAEKQRAIDERARKGDPLLLATA